MEGFSYDRGWSSRERGWPAEIPISTSRTGIPHPDHELGQAGWTELDAGRSIVQFLTVVTVTVLFLLLAVAMERHDLS